MANKNLLTDLAISNKLETLQPLTTIDTIGGATLSVKDTNLGKALSMLDSLETVNKGADKAICLLIAYIDRTKAYKALGFKNIVDMFAQWDTTRYAKSTTHTYCNIGKTCYDVAGNPRINGIDTLSKGQLIPLLGLINNYPCIGDYQFTDSTIEFLISEKALARRTSETIKGYCKSFRDGLIPEELLDLDEDGEPTFDGVVIDSDYIATAKDDETETENETETETETETVTETDNDTMTIDKAIDMVRMGSLALDTLGVDAKLVKALEKAIDAIAKSVNAE